MQVFGATYGQHRQITFTAALQKDIDLGFHLGAPSHAPNGAIWGCRTRLFLRISDAAQIRSKTLDRLWLGIARQGQGSQLPQGRGSITWPHHFSPWCSFLWMIFWCTKSVQPWFRSGAACRWCSQETGGPSSRPVGFVVDMSIEDSWEKSHPLWHTQNPIRELLGSTQTGF